MSLTRENTITRASLLKFLLPSLVGIVIFLTPVDYQGKQTIVIGVITNWLRQPLAAILLEVVVLVTVVAALGSAYYLLVRPDWKRKHPSLYAICDCTPIWFVLRATGALFGLMVYFQFGPELIWGKDTGYVVFTEIGVGTLFTLSLACFLMPFLTEFGFMEFIGGIVRKPFGWLFRLPGRSAIDATASFVAAAPVGLLITISQYESGFYSARESAAVATNFSVVSIPFALVVAGVAGLEHIFFTWYLVVIASCLICALITVRVPPLSRIPDNYYASVGKQIDEEIPKGVSNFSWSLQQATQRAARGPDVTTFLRNGWLSALDVVFGVIAPAMAIATAASILMFHTPLFEWLAYPIAMVLEWLQVPHAKAAAPGFLVGFLDQFIPALVAKPLDSEFTRFILAGLSVCQLIYMAEVGVIILRSSLPISFLQLLVMFALRTVILFPVLLLFAHWLY